MIRAFDALTSGVVNYTAPSPRRRQTRRRTAAIAVVLGVAFAGGLIGQLSARDAAGPVPPGPFSYFPN